MVPRGGWRWLAPNREPPSWFSLFAAPVTSLAVGRFQEEL